MRKNLVPIGISAAILLFLAALAVWSQQPVAQSGSPWGFNMTEFGGSSVSLGQQTAANSMPVILPSATVTTLTPPSNTGYSTTTDQCGYGISNPCLIGGEGSGAVENQPACDTTVIENAFSTSGATQLVALSSGKKIYVCGWFVNGASTTLNTVKLQTGTGTACASNTADFSIAVPIQAPSSVAPAGSNIAYAPNVIKATPASYELCVNLSAAQAVNLEVNYTQQ